MFQKRTHLKCTREKFACFSTFCLHNIPFNLLRSESIYELRSLRHALRQKDPSRLVMRVRLCVFRRASNRIIIFSLNRFASSFLLHFFLSPLLLLTFLKTNFPLFLNLSLNIYTSPSNGFYFLSFRLFIIPRKGFLWCHLESTVSLVFLSFLSTQNISFLFCFAVF